MMKSLQLFLTVMLICCSSSILLAQPAIGSTVPDIVLKDSALNVRRLSDLRGKVVLIDFWASWCGPCRKSNREMRPFYQKMKGFEIFAVSLDKEYSDWKKAIKTDRTPWIQTIDTGGWEAATALAWNIEALPSSFLIDKEGKLLIINPSRGDIQRILKSGR